MKINEKTLRQIIRESLGELNSYQLQRAVDKSPRIAKNGIDAFYYDRNREMRRHQPSDWDSNSAAGGIAEIREVLDAYEESYHGYGDSPVKKCQQYLDYIENFLLRKQKQQDNLYDRSEDLRYEESDAFYGEVARILGIPFDPKRGRTEQERSIETKLGELSEYEWNQLLTQLSPDARNYAENYF